MSASLIAKARLDRRQRWESLDESLFPDAMVRWNPSESPPMNAYTTENLRSYNLRSRKDNRIQPAQPTSPDREKQMLPQSEFNFPKQTGGIIPGYKGHIRGSKEVIAGSLFGELAAAKKPDFGPSVMQRDQSVYRDDPRAPMEKPRRIDNRGILPGATYYVPGANEVVGASTFEH